MNTTLPAVIADAVQDGHVLVSDPPASITSVQRWTCTACGAAVLAHGENLYGSATTQPCDAS